MEKITVYRVEHAVQQTGPYRVEVEFAVRLSDAHSGDPLRPHPSNDGLGHWMNWDEKQDEAIFGCASLEALRQWFDGWEEDLHEQGYCISVYRSNTENPYILYGKKQVQFSYTDFDLVEQMPLQKTSA